MRVIEQIFRLLAPHYCLSCGVEGRLLCAWCAEAALPETESRCYRCNRLTDSSAVCSSCRRQSALSHLWVRTEYSETAKMLIHSMKFKYSGEAADVIAAELMNTLPALPPRTVIVHVPTASRHMRERGFDHALRIARGLSKESNQQFIPALARLGQARQVGSSRMTRIKQMQDVFRVRPFHDMNGARILLVDDVLTTGATIEAAARALKAAGAKSVDAVIFAKAK